MNKKLYKEVWDRDNGTCVICGSDRFLHVHHFQDVVNKEFISAYIKEIPEYLVTLCSTCHGKIHGKGGGRRKWKVRRQLAMKLFGVDIGECEIHRWEYINGLTICSFCKMPKPGQGEKAPHQ